MDRIATAESWTGLEGSPPDGTSQGVSEWSYRRSSGSGNMNLLPKSSKEFGSVDYWEKFFQQRGKKAFEWYGTYLELCEVLHKYIKPRERVRSAACSPVCALGKVGADDCNPALGGQA